MTKIGRMCSWVAVVAVLGAPANSLAQEDSVVSRAIADLRSACAAQNDEKLQTASDAITGLGGAAKEALSLLTKTGTEAEICLALRCLRAIDRSFDCGLEALLGHRAAAVRADAVVSLSMVHQEKAAPLLEKAFGDVDVMVQRRALDGLCEYAPHTPAAAEIIAAGLLSPDFWIGQRVLELLSQQDATRPGAVEALTRKLRGQLLRLRAGTAEKLYLQLAQTWGEASVPLIKAGLESSNDDAKWGALAAVEILKPENLFSPTLSLLDCRDERVHLRTVTVLGVYEDRRAFKGLVAALAAADSPAVRDAAAVALRRITGKLHGFDVGGWKRELENAEDV